jgi:hypothetical protein
MENQFANVQHHVGDVYVADYTQFASEHPELAERGVVVSDLKPEQIGSLLFRNPNGVKVLSVNFEKNSAVFKFEDGGKVSNCECMLVSEQGNKKRWLALAELKYCKGEDRNIASNFEDALGQLRDTFLHLRDVAGLFKDDDYRYFWIVSMPEHSDKVPFSAFVLSQDELMAYKDLYNSVIISDNVVDIWTGTVIKLPVY